MKYSIILTGLILTVGGVFYSEDSFLMNIFFSRGFLSPSIFRLLLMILGILSLVFGALGFLKIIDLDF